MTLGGWKYGSRAALATVTVLVGCGGKQVSPGAATCSVDAGDAEARAESSLVLRQVLAPTIPANGACFYTADPTQGGLSTGAVDVSFPKLGTYAPALLFGNTSASRAFVDGASTNITDLAGGNIVALISAMCAKKDAAACATKDALTAHPARVPPGSFSSIESGAAEPGSSRFPSYGTISVTLIDAATFDVVRTYFENALKMNGSAAFTTSIQLLTYTTLQGTATGGTAVKSNQYEFAVSFTFGGLLNNLKTDPSAAFGHCLDTSMLPMPGSQTCVEGQDVAVAAAAVLDIPDCPEPKDAGTGD
jgi:hypothetical protein